MSKTDCPAKQQALVHTGAFLINPHTPPTTKAAHYGATNVKFTNDTVFLK